MNGKKRRNEPPVTGILAGVIAILIIVLALLVTGYRRVISDAERAGKESVAETESELQAADGTLGETELNNVESELVYVIGTEDSYVSPGDELETEAATDREAEILSEADLGEELSSENELQTENESETETDTEETADKLVVAIDPGHQGSWVDMSDTEPLGPGSAEMKAKSSTGTQGTYSGVPEYELNLEISLLLRTELQDRGYEVILTREDNDTAISNAERATLAYELGGDIYVRIHANGSENSSVSGALAMVPSASNPYVGDLAEDSYLLAECILASYCETAGFDSLGIQYYDNMTGINWSKIPVMILEMGFMTNESDDLRMTDSSIQTLMVQGIADGIDDYFEQKGMKNKDSSNAEESLMNSLIKILGEGYIYPASDMGETWAVSVLNLDDGTSCDINGDVSLKSASVLKVFIMAALYDRVICPSSEETRITVEESYEGELDDLISLMITVSDNSASNTLVTMLGGGDAQAGMDVVNEYLEENGYTGTSMGRLFLEENPSGDNYTTSNDCMRLLKRIYEGACVGEAASEQMVQYLKEQTLTDKIPSALAGENVTTANKTGELAGEYGDYVENDIAIVVSEKTAYVLCVLSNELQDNSSAVSRIIQMSELVYDTLVN